MLRVHQCWTHLLPQRKVRLFHESVHVVCVRMLCMYACCHAARACMLCMYTCCACIHAVRAFACVHVITRAAHTAAEWFA